MQNSLQWRIVEFLLEGLRMFKGQELSIINYNIHDISLELVKLALDLILLSLFMLIYSIVEFNEAHLESLQQRVLMLRLDMLKKHR